MIFVVPFILLFVQNGPFVQPALCSMGMEPFSGNWSSFLPGLSALCFTAHFQSWALHFTKWMQSRPRQKCFEEKEIVKSIWWHHFTLENLVSSNQKGTCLRFQTFPAVRKVGNVRNSWWNNYPLLLLWVLGSRVNHT